MREITLKNGEYYHIYNRGVDKREIFADDSDYYRFLKSLKEFNQIEPIISLYIKGRINVAAEPLKTDKLVEIIAYCLNPNHFHLILKQLMDGGISEFMKRVGGGYTGYFNYKNKRTGVLFQGKFKTTHIDSNEKLIYLSAYVNGNYNVHNIKKAKNFSSFPEYLANKKFLCNPEVILSQFSSIDDYCKYVENTVKEVNKIRADLKKQQME